MVVDVAITLERHVPSATKLDRRGKRPRTLFNAESGHRGAERRHKNGHQRGAVQRRRDEPARAAVGEGHVVFGRECKSFCMRRAAFQD